MQYLDSDDCLHEKAIEYLLDKAEASNADIVVAPFQFCYLDGTSYKSSFLISQVCLVLITLKKY